jgi:hypothetical protein
MATVAVCAECKHEANRHELKDVQWCTDIDGLHCIAECHTLVSRGLFQTVLPCTCTMFKMTMPA